MIALRTDQKRVPRKTLAAEVRQLRNDVRGMRLDAKKVSVKSAKVNTTVQEKS